MPGAPMTWTVARSSTRRIRSATAHRSLAGCLDQALGSGARLRGDLGAGEHARDLLAALVGIDLGDAGGDTLALVDRALADEVMAVGARGHLRRMRHRDHLRPTGEPRQPHADGIGDRTAD